MSPCDAFIEKSLQWEQASRSSEISESKCHNSVQFDRLPSNPKASHWHLWRILGWPHAWRHCQRPSGCASPFFQASGCAKEHLAGASSIVSLVSMLLKGPWKTGSRLFMNDEIAPPMVQLNPVNYGELGGLWWKPRLHNGSVLYFASLWICFPDWGKICCQPSMKGWLMDAHGFTLV